MLKFSTLKNFEKIAKKLKPLKFSRLQIAKNLIRLCNQAFELTLKKKLKR